MKTIYYIYTNEFLNGKELYHRGLGYHPKWRYGELPTLSTKIYYDFDEVYNHPELFDCVYPDFTFWKHRQYLCGAISWDDYINVFKEDFKEFKVVYKIRELKNYTMEDLMKELRAEEFIEYCKDNGLNICPIGGI